MKKILQIIGAICIVALLLKGLGYIQCDHREALVSSVDVLDNGTYDVYFKIQNGNVYRWNTKDTCYNAGQHWKIAMFDCETVDSSDDYIVKVEKFIR